MTVQQAVIVVVLVAIALRLGIMPPITLRADRSESARFVRHAIPLTISASVLQFNLLTDRAVATLIAARCGERAPVCRGSHPDPDERDRPSMDRGDISGPGPGLPSERVAVVQPGCGERVALRDCHLRATGSGHGRPGTRDRRGGLRKRSLRRACLDPDVGSARRVRPTALPDDGKLDPDRSA